MTQSKYTPPRMLGRVKSDDWAVVKAAAKRAGVPFTRWAIQVLLKAAARQK